MSLSADEDGQPPAPAMSEATLRVHLSRLTDRFALALSSADGFGRSPSGTESLTPRDGLSTSNSACTGECMEPPSFPRKDYTMRGGGLSDGNRLHRHAQAAPSTSSSRPHVAAASGGAEAKAVLMFSQGSGPPGGVGGGRRADTPAATPPTSDARRLRHARPASAPVAAATTSTDTANAQARFSGEDLGGLGTRRSSGRAQGDLAPRPSRPMHTTLGHAPQRRSASRQASRASSNTSSRASTPRSVHTGIDGSGCAPRQRPASAQPVSGRAMGSVGAPSAPSNHCRTRDDGGDLTSPQVPRTPGRVYVRRLIRLKPARAIIPKSPYYTTTAAAAVAGTSHPPAPSPTQRVSKTLTSSPSTCSTRAYLTRPTVIARRDTVGSHATPRATSPVEITPRSDDCDLENKDQGRRENTPGGSEHAPAAAPHLSAASAFSLPPPLATLHGKTSVHARRDAPAVAPLNAADVAMTTTTEDLVSHSRTKPSPALSSPSNGLASVRPSEFTPHALPGYGGLGGVSRRSSMRRVSRSHSSIQAGCPSRPIGGGSAQADQGTIIEPVFVAEPPSRDPCATPSPLSDSTSPDIITSPFALAQRLRERGNDCFRRGDYAAAIAHYSEGLQLQPSNDVMGCNRAAAYLMSCQYAAALVDCKWVLLHAPKNLSAHWRAAKSFLYMNRLAEARRFYRTARQLSEEDYAMASIGSSHRRDSMRSRGGSLGSGTTHAGGGHSGNIKWLKDRRSICAEEAALTDVEVFWQQMRERDWPAAINTTARLMEVFGCDGPTAAVWQARQLEAMLHVEPRQSMDKVRALRQLYPDCLDLIFAEAKALFYCAHDDHSTRQCLALLDELRARAETMNDQLRHTVQQLARHVYRTNPSQTSTAAVSPDNDVESWAHLYQWKADSRLVQLQRSIELFSKYRDEGNAAYAKSDWAAAHNAYTRCLQVDPDNRSLMSAIYCNRSAVAMQSSRWKDALGDAHTAIELNPLHTKAVSRRGRIYLHLFQQQEERLYHSSSLHSGSREWIRTAQDAMLRYLDAAVEDFKTAANLAPQDQKLQQDLNEAMQCRHGFLQQQQQQAQQSSRPFSAHARGPPPPSPSASTYSHARQRRGPQFFTADDDDNDDDRGSPRAHRQQTGARYRARSSGGGGAGTGTNRGSGDGGNKSVDSRAVLLGYINILELPTSAYASGRVDSRALTKAYRDAALRWHPDKWVSGTAQEKALAEMRFKEVTVAYTALKECAV